MLLLFHDLIRRQNRVPCCHLPYTITITITQCYLPPYTRYAGTQLTCDKDRSCVELNGGCLHTILYITDIVRAITGKTLWGEGHSCRLRGYKSLFSNGLSLIALHHLVSLPVNMSL